MRPTLTRLGRIFHIGVRNFIRNAWLSTAATAVMFVTLTILLSSFAINSALSDTVDDIAQDITLSVFLQNDISEEDRQGLERSFSSDPNVIGIDYINQQQALAIFQNDNADDPELLEGIALTDDVFPASFELTLLDLTQIQSVIDLAEGEQFSEIVEETSASQERLKSINNIANAQDFITIGSLAMAGVFAGIAVLIIFNTIRMAIFTRSEEIEIMKLVGATPGYIRGPFLLEASLYGVIAAILAITTVYGVLFILGPSSNYLVMDPTIDFFISEWYVIFFVTCGIGLLIGFVSSSLAMTKYLRLRTW